MCPRTTSKRTTNFPSCESFSQFRITCDNFKARTSLAQLHYDFDFVASSLFYTTRITHSLPFQIVKVSKNCVHSVLVYYVVRITYVLEIADYREQVNVLSRYRRLYMLLVPVWCWESWAVHWLCTFFAVVVLNRYYRFE